MRKSVREKISRVLAAGAILAYMPVSAEFTEDSEFHGMGDNVMELINAAAAYEAGYTGKGVILGIADYPVNFLHPEFSGKENSMMVNQVGDGNYDWYMLFHGTHVAGIMAGARNQQGMQGVAYDADLWSSSVAGEFRENGRFKIRGDVYDELLKNEAIKIINNSWGTSVCFDGIDSEEVWQEAENYIHSEENQIKWRQLKKAGEAGRLLVFAAGNDGHLMPFIGIFGGKAGHLLNVTALDSSNWTRQGEQLAGNSGGIAVFSNLAQFAEDWTLAAPGVNINSAYADFANEDFAYVGASGTSMAAPMVSGIGGLVQQAFPYLSGKQIGDVLLSTANDQLTFSDGYTLTVQEFGNDIERINVFLIGNDAGWEGAALTERLQKYYEEHYVELEYTYGIQSLEEWLSLPVEIYQNTPIEALVGQGIADAGKAVQGLGAINMRRLTKEDISDQFTVQGEQTKQALYTVDTQGYDSVWSNDIKEIRSGYIADDPLGNGDTAGVEDLYDRWVYYTANMGKGNDYFINKYIKDYNEAVEASGLLGLHGGLYKMGDGVLSLTGTNTYEGSSIAAEGILQIDGSVAGDAYSIDEGILAGKGTIRGLVKNNGGLLAGSWGSTDTLTIEKDLTGTGDILVVTDGEKYNEVTVQGTADIREMDIVSGGLAAPDQTGTILTAETLLGTDRTGEFSGLLDAEVTIQGNAVVLTTTAANHTGGNEDVFAGVNSLYEQLGAEEKKELYSLYGLDKERAGETLGDLRGDLHETIGQDILKNRDVRAAAAAQRSLAREEGIWMETGKHWTEVGDSTGHGYRMTVGMDIERNEQGYWGGFVSYSSNSVSESWDKGDYDSYSFGMYGSAQRGRGEWNGYVSYGRQEIETERYLKVLGKELKTSYDGRLLGIGAEYSYQAAEGEAWKLEPYVRSDASWFDRDSWEEAGTYGLRSEGTSGTYWTGELGIRAEKKEKEGRYGIQIGYERVLDGNNQENGVQFAKGGSGFTAVGEEDSRNRWQAGIYGEYEGDNGWSAGGSVEEGWSSAGNEVTASLYVRRAF